MTITDIDQFADGLTDLEIMLQEARETIHALSGTPTPGNHEFVLIGTRNAETIARLSQTIEDTYEAVFEYANAQRQTDGPGVQFWEKVFTGIEKGYESVCETKHELRIAEIRAKSVDNSGKYIVIGEGPISDDEEFIRQAKLLGKVYEGAERTITDPLAILESDSLRLFNAATTIDAVGENLIRYASKKALDDQNPKQVEWMVLDATLRAGTEKLTTVSNKLTNVGIAVYLDFESSEAGTRL
jgi:hypothetical protein